MAAWLEGNDGLAGGAMRGRRPRRSSGRWRRTRRLTTKFRLSVNQTTAATRRIAHQCRVAMPTAAPATIQSRPSLPSAEYPITTRSRIRWRSADDTRLGAEAGAPPARDDPHGVGDVVDPHPDAALVVLDVHGARAGVESALDARPVGCARLA